MTREEAISRINNDLEWHKKELSAAYKTALNMAIEALKFCEVYDKTIEAVNKFYDDHHAQIVNWTPCSERLPDAIHNYDGFLVTVTYCDMTDVFIKVYLDGKFGMWDGDRFYADENVIAWMELPEPYQEDKQ